MGSYSMQAKVLFGLGLALLTITQTLAVCNCGMAEGGSDACHIHKEGLVVRPVKPSKIQNYHSAPAKIICAKFGGGGVEKLKPVGDVCTSCGHTIVQPAFVPKQKCSHCQQKLYNPYYGYDSYAYNKPIPAPPGLNDFEPEDAGGDYYEHDSYGPYYGEENGYGYYGPHQHSPADAVSLSLAYGLQHQIAKNVQEEKLQFGFSQLPKDAPVVKAAKNIPEERLYTVEKQVIELKPYITGYAGAATLEQEAEEDLLAQQAAELEVEEEVHHLGNAYLSYKDLGYAPESVKKTPFIVNPGIKEHVYEELLPPVEPHCNDGYIPGSVISKSEVVDIYEDANTSDAYSSDEDLGYESIKYITNAYDKGPYPYGPFLKKLGCGSHY